MVDLKEKKRANDCDRFKPVPNPNYKPLENKTQPQVTNSTKKTDDIIPKDSIYQINTSLPSSSPSSSSSLSKISTHKPDTSEIETPKDNTAHINTVKSNNNQIKNNPLPQENTPPVFKSPRISPLHSISPDSIINSRRHSSVQLIPPPLPTSPRPSTASLFLNQSQEKDFTKKEERWTISSSRRLDTLPVKVNNPRINEKSFRLFLSNPLPTPPKHTEFRTSSGFGIQEYTTQYQPSLVKQPSCISDQNFKWNQSQQNERPFEITQNK